MHVSQYLAANSKATEMSADVIACCYFITWSCRKYSSLSFAYGGTALQVTEG